MYRTFNMGYGFAIVVSPKDVAPALDSLNNLCPAEDVGHVTTDGKISVESGFTERAIFL
jgi:phosphoribosylaminoimidazole (AIR) synthetase